MCWWWIAGIIASVLVAPFAFMGVLLSEVASGNDDWEGVVFSVFAAIIAGGIVGFMTACVCRVLHLLFAGW